MFFKASFNQPLNSWDVSYKTKTMWMFEGASLFDNKINSWNVSTDNKILV